MRDTLIQSFMLPKEYDIEIDSKSKNTGQVIKDFAIEQHIKILRYIILGKQ